jgi:hypothetical protein
VENVENNQKKLILKMWTGLNWLRIGGFCEDISERLSNYRFSLTTGPMELVTFLKIRAANDLVSQDDSEFI